MIRQTPTVVSHAMRESGTPPYSAARPMPPAAIPDPPDPRATMSGGAGLTPALAVDYVRELSADVRAVVVLDVGGEPLAGPLDLTDPARALLDASGDAAELDVGTDAGVVCAVRSAAHAAVAVCGRFAIGGVVRADLRAALAALEGRALAAPAGGADAATDSALLAAADALIFAVQRASAA
jgi:hypothetical protein